MFYERRIESLSGIIKEARTMDADAGIRISGRYGGRRCYAFVTRFGRRYTVMVYARKAGAKDGVGPRLDSEEMEGPEKLRPFLKRIVSDRVEAFAY